MNGFIVIGTALWIIFIASAVVAGLRERKVLKRGTGPVKHERLKLRWKSNRIFHH